MNFVKRHPLFSIILAVFVLLFATEVWFVVILRTEVAAAERDVRARIDEIEQLHRQKPAPDEQNLRVARDDLAQNAEVLTTMLRVLNVTGPDDLEFFKGEPTTRPDAWFEISQFVDRMTNEARKSGVDLKPDERFGFAAYTYEGPEPAYIQGVYRQHRIVEYLLQKLFAARPRSLIAVQREEPLAKGPPSPPATPATPVNNRPGGASGNAQGAVPEIFVLDPQVSARTPGYVDSMAFRVMFSGHTSSLRGFMNALAAPDIPLVVRSVEVAAGNGPANRQQGAQSGPGRPGTPGRPANPFTGATAEPAAPQVNKATVPIVAENASVFTVTVELFDVKIRAPGSTGPVQPVAPPPAKP